MEPIGTSCVSWEVTKRQLLFLNAGHWFRYPLNVLWVVCQELNVLSHILHPRFGRWMIDTLYWVPRNIYITCQSIDVVCKVQVFNLSSSDADSVAMVLRFIRQNPFWEDIEESRWQRETMFNAHSNSEPMAYDTIDANCYADLDIQLLCGSD